MANTNKFVVKNGLQSQNVDFVSPNGANTITLSISDSDVLSISGNAGQLFSITDSFSGTIFSANDVSGIPSIEVLDTGLVKLAQYSGNVLLGTGTDNATDKLQVNGSITGSVLKSTAAIGTAPFVVTSTTLVTNLNANFLGGQSSTYYTTAGNLTGTLPSGVLANSSLFIGTTSVALNRASANLALTGISSVTLPGATSGTIVLTPTATAGTTTITLPATTGTVITTGDTGTVTNTMLAGSIATSKITGLATSATTDTTNATNITSGTLSGDRGVTAGSTSSSFVEYNGTTKTAGQFDGGTTAPTDTTRLNYDGYLYATRFYGDGSQLTGISLPSGQTSGSATSGYLQYAGTTKTAGQLDGGTVEPSSTTRLNYDGYLYATRFYGDGSNLTGLSISAAGYAIAMALILS